GREDREIGIVVGAREDGDAVLRAGAECYVVQRAGPGAALPTPVDVGTAGVRDLGDAGARVRPPARRPRLTGLRLDDDDAVRCVRAVERGRRGPLHHLDGFDVVRVQVVEPARGLDLERGQPARHFLEAV